MEKPTVLLTDSDLGDRELEAGWLRDEIGAEVVIANCASSDDVVAAIMQHRPYAIVNQWTPLDDRAIAAAAPTCKVISRIGIGIDMIDREAAERAGIAVLNVPHYCTEEVATHAVALAMALWRRLPSLDAEVRAGEWNAAQHGGNISRLSQATVGLIGCGRIGALVGRAFEVWGCKVVVVDPASGADGYERVSIDELAERADIISLHAPLLESTRHIIDGGLLSRLARRPVLVNTSRGALIDVEAAAAAVTDGRLRGLGLDVFESEPLPIGHVVRTAPNTILSPHAAWCSAEALPDLRRGAIDNVITSWRQRLEKQGAES